MERIYLDHNATTPMHPEVLDAMLPYYKDIFGNASSVHSFGREARKAIDEARASVADILSCQPEEIIFTSGGTESNNFAIKGIAMQLKDKGNHIITSSIEHHAVLNPCGFLEKQGGFKVTYLPVDKYGLINPDDLKTTITDKTILVTIMYANNEVGTIEPIEELAKIAKQKGVLFHTDAVQVVGKLPVDVNKLGIDLLSLSAHKLYGPKGAGALYIRKKTKITPLIQGGHHERNLRAGTENVAGIAGLGTAAQIAKQEMAEEAKRLAELSSRLYNGLNSKIENIRSNGHPQERLPNTINLSFRFVEGESIILNLDMEGIAVSTGSACTSGSLEPSHVLTAMGVDPVDTQGSIRFSLGRINTEAEIDRVIEILPPIIGRLRAMSPLYHKK